jgi:predicted alpha/beta-hydrolase family hydrolase
MEKRFETAHVYGFLYEPEQPSGDGIALTHGAGGNCNSQLLVRLAQAFTDAGWLALRYDLPFRREGKGAPHLSKQGRDRDGVRHAVAELRKRSSGKIVAGGQSYGGRMTAMAAAEDPGMTDGLLLLSYPLHPPGKHDQKRTQFFPDLRNPVLFVSGTSDPFGSPEELRDAIAAIPARKDVLLVDGAGHDLKRGADMAADILTRLHALVV